MKKLICILLTFFACVSLFANVNDVNRQKISPLSNSVYDAMESLYISQGLALPSTTKPWSDGEMDIMLSRINPNALTENEKLVYSFLQEQINKSPRLNPDENFGINISLDINAVTYAHTNAKEYTSFDDFYSTPDFKFQTPILSVPLETWIGKNIYGFSSFDLGAARTIAKGYKDVNFLTNILFIPPIAIGDFDLSFPHRAIGVIGGDNWYFSLGRDQMKWGPGESGNLTLGDQLPYHDNARFTAFSDKFKYTFSLSSFLHPSNYVRDENGLDYVDDMFNQTKNRNGIKMFIAHRLEWRIKNKVNMALTESIMYQSENNHIDLLVLSPTAVFHNYYIRNNANSLLSLELDYTPIKYLNLYAEGVIDEFMLPGENGSNLTGPPTSFGFILGAKTAIPLGRGMLKASIEGAYTDPYLYLRDDGQSYNGNKYGINFVANFPSILGGNLFSDYNFTTYKYGNDSIVGSIKASYEDYDFWKVASSLTYIADGCMDMHSRWRQVKNNTADDPNAPTDKPNGNSSYLPGDNTALRNAIAHHLVLNFKGEIKLLNSLNIFSELTFLNTWNYLNEKGKSSSDIRFILGLSYRI